MSDPGTTDAPRYGTIDREYGMRLATTPPDDDGPVWMVNLMNYREVAEYADGRESTISGREADDLYAPLGPLAGSRCRGRLRRRRRSAAARRRRRPGIASAS